MTSPIAAALILLLATGSLAADDEETEAKTPEEATYIGAEMCSACHQAAVTSYESTPHGHALADESRPEDQRGCEACHGAGSAHFEAAGQGGIMAFGRDVAADTRSAPCRTCHAGQPGLHDFTMSAHALASVACTDCHRAHGGTEEGLLAKATPSLCYQCHADIRAKFAMPEHHEVNEGVLSCLDCHDAHGTRNPQALLAPNTDTCTRCHSDIEGPFVFEHAAVVTEGCVGCHEPHGTMNRHLLIRQQVAQLCYQCHMVTPSNHTQPAFRDCTRCHVAVHGSNTDPRFLER